MSMSGHLGDLLSALLDGELEYTEAAAARAHLQGCPFCRAELEAAGGARDLVRALPMMEMPADLLDAVVGDVAPVVSIGAARRASRMRPLTALAGVAAAAALVVLAVAPKPAHTAKPPVSTFVDAHATASSDGDPVTGLAPVAVPASFTP
jgi:anti-sigma factor RsiW